MATLLSAERARADTDTSPVTYLYHTAQDAQYRLDVFKPVSCKASSPRPAIVFFHGGGWVNGNKGQFRRQAQILTQKTCLIAISADYPTHGNPVESTGVAQGAVCWVKAHATELGIDAGRIAVSGGSAGGQLAAAVALISSKLASECSQVNPPYGDLLILFNPAISFTKSEEQKAGVPLASVSPMELVSHHALPPTLIMQGTADQTTPLAVARQFADIARSNGSTDVQIVEFPGRSHGFFNDQETGDLDTTVNDTIAFLRKQRWPIDRDQ